MRYQNICSASFSFVVMHACDRQTYRRTDKRTDRITTPKAALAYARAVKSSQRARDGSLVDVSSLWWDGFCKTGEVKEQTVIVGGECAE